MPTPIQTNLPVPNEALPIQLASRVERLITLAMSQKKSMATVLAGLDELISSVEANAVVSIERSTTAKQAKIRARNVVAFAKMEEAAFKKLSEAGALLTSEEVQAILNVRTRQAVSRRLKANAILGYRYKSNVYYPSFQFDDMGMNPLIAELWQSVVLREEKERIPAQMNGFIRFLEAEENISGVIRHRYEQLSKDSMCAIRSQYLNKCEMGR